MCLATCEKRMEGSNFVEYTSLGPGKRGLWLCKHGMGAKLLSLAFALLLPKERRVPRRGAVGKLHGTLSRLPMEQSSSRFISFIHWSKKALRQRKAAPLFQKPPSRLFAEIRHGGWREKERKVKIKTPLLLVPRKNSTKRAVLFQPSVRHEEEQVLIGMALASASPPWVI